MAFSARGSTNFEREKGEDLMKNFVRRGNPNGGGRRGIPLLDDDKKACT
jgi:hypothetical protein